MTRGTSGHREGAPTIATECDRETSAFLVCIELRPCHIALKSIQRTANYTILILSVDFLNNAGNATTNQIVREFVPRDNIVISEAWTAQLFVDTQEPVCA